LTGLSTAETAVVVDLLRTAPTPGVSVPSRLTSGIGKLEKPDPDGCQKVTEKA
jgi:hypothetical protein